MRRTIKLITNTIALVSLLAIPALVPFMPESASAARPGLGDSECVQDGNNCRDPNPGTPNNNGGAANPNGQGAVGADPAGTAAACQGLSQLGGTSCGGGAGKSAVGSVAAKAVEIISYIAGIIAIIMIIISAIRFITSNGDASKVGTAKTALVYALIGIAVAGLAQVLVRFVLGTAASV